MQGMVSKLQTIGMLIALVSAIGGGFYTWGTFNQRLDVIEDKEFVVNQEVDLTEVYKAIEELRGDIKINGAALDYLEARLNEFKTEQSNPLLN
jgi:nitrate/TMAO reductase-like tetraheme cytochrome c subunit|tara:strand:- start:91 stop:369 length:279 start_codon:yes stop_codon:yes gene_type:complete